MTARRSRDPSPARAAIIHGSVGALTFFGTLGLGGAFVHYTGDAAAGSPVVRMALFENGTPTQTGTVSSNFATATASAMPAATQQANFLRQSQFEEVLQPDLGVEYTDRAAPSTTSTTPRSAPAPQRVAAASPPGITINGKVVPFGKSFSEVDAATNEGNETIQLNSLGIVGEQAPAKPMREGPYTRHAKAFENPDGKPTVSIIVGGLGINWGRTQAAISELPPEVTLSFAPTAQNLRSWVAKARRAGHEVLIELPMEPYDYGRLTPHPYVLQNEASAADNLARLDKLLARTSGYLGVMNYQGSRFATDAKAVGPIMARLEAKGIAFFEDGRLTKSEFVTSAGELSMAFGRATAQIDARMEADEITTQFMLLEATATETGKALGTGMSFPLTLDLLKEWIPTLEDKGILLAPASHFAKPAGMTTSKVELAALDSQG